MEGRRKMAIRCMAIAIVTVVLTGCGNKIIYPDGWTVPKEVETGNLAETEDSGEVQSETAAVETEAPSFEDKAEREASDEPDNYYFDLSGSMKRSPQVTKIYACAMKAGAGRDINYWSIDDGRNLVEIDSARILSSQYSYGAALDIVGEADIPVNTAGINVFTTDLQSNTTGAEFGRWLAHAGCTGYSFYVFSIDYIGSVDFKAYTSSDALEYISVSDCSFEREFLMVVFGDEKKVRNFDTIFQNRSGDLPGYDMCHVSMEGDNVQGSESILSLASSRCFDDNLANITYDGTNYCYGLALADETEAVEFTMENTFVYTRSSKSANADTDAVKVILYAVPDTEMAAIDRIDTKVWTYDAPSKSWKESPLAFSVRAEGYIDGMPAAVDDEALNTKLGGNIVAEGNAVFAAVVENTSLLKGLYAIETRMVGDRAGAEKTFQEFKDEHSAGLEEYVAALQTECTARTVDGNVSTSEYIWTGSNASVFSKLLDFEGLADELLAAGAAADEQNIIFRLVIDNR